MPHPSRQSVHQAPRRRGSPGILTVVIARQRRWSRGKPGTRRTQGGYSNPALDARSDRALPTFERAERETLLTPAVKVTNGGVAPIPLRQLDNFWASKKAIVDTPRMDERSVAVNARMVKQRVVYFDIVIK